MSDKINPNQLNPVDYYNKNHIQDCIDRLLEIKSFHQSGQDAITYVQNKSDFGKRMIVVKNNLFIAEEKNGLGIEIGEAYTPFMMLQAFVHKTSFKSALGYVIFDLMGNDVNFVRIGIKYFKKITKKDRFGIVRLDLKLWDKTTVIDDYGKNFLSTIPTFDDFTIQPNNKDYKAIIDNNYNLYSEFNHQPCHKMEYDDKKWQWTRNLLKHIFGDHYHLGIIYMKVLYDLPTQALPILVLTSEERQTGKSTVVDWLSVVFGDNMVVVNPADIGRDFNGSYANKNIIAIEESRFDKQSTLEKLKNLSTQKKITVNSKFTPEYSIPFYGKLIITSNDENKFSKVDNPEIRYWVRKVPTLKGKANHKILDSLSEEIPYFLYHLNTLPDIDTSKSRMVFLPEEIETKALKKVKEESRSELYKEIEMLIDDYGRQNATVETFYFAAVDIKDKFFKHNNQYSNSYISKTIKHDMKLEKVEKNMKYAPLEENGINNHKKSGIPFIYKNKHYLNGSEAKDSDSDDDNFPF